MEGLFREWCAFSIWRKNMVISLNTQKEPEKITSTKELAEYIRKSVMEDNELSDEEKAGKEAGILNKLKFGKKLTPEELRYLQKVNPIMYAQAMRVQAMAKAVEEQVKHARSKEEANQIVSNAMSSISKENSAREYMVAAIDRVSSEMHKSPGYNRLPNTDADVQKAKGKKSDISFKELEDDEGDGDSFDLNSWSQLQEVMDEMPKFDAGA